MSRNEVYRSGSTARCVPKLYGARLRRLRLRTASVAAATEAAGSVAGAVASAMRSEKTTEGNARMIDPKPDMADLKIKIQEMPDSPLFILS